jgi:hypothetical protein
MASSTYLVYRLSRHVLFVRRTCVLHGSEELTVRCFYSPLYFCETWSYQRDKDYRVSQPYWNAVWNCRQTPTFREDILPTSSGFTIFLVTCDYKTSPYKFNTSYYNYPPINAFTLDVPQLMSIDYEVYEFVINSGWKNGGSLLGTQRRNCVP